MDISKEELLNIASLVSLKLSENEVQLFSKQIKTILDYADQLQQVELTKEVENIRNKNVFREDVVVQCKSDKILGQAPEKHDRYFQVPKILD